MTDQQNYPDHEAFFNALLRWLQSQDVSPHIALPAMAHVIGTKIADTKDWPTACEGLLVLNKLMIEAAIKTWEDRQSAWRTPEAPA